MSRRKQENPQPRKRLINAEAELLQDTLTCGSCQKVFVLSEIVKFIQHKVNSCNKENNFIILEDGVLREFDSDHDEGNPPPAQQLVAASKAPSISAPICNRKGLHHQHHHLHRNRNRPDKGIVSPNSVPSFRFGGGDKDESPWHKKEPEDSKKMLKVEPGTNDEAKDLSVKHCSKVMVNAYTNTIITEPSTYTCSTCKQTFTSAWVLVQHAQHMHGMKIYLVTPYHGSRSSSSVLAPSGPPPSLINSNSGLGIPMPPVLPPSSAMNGPTHLPHAHHHSVLPQQTLSLENHPALQLLRMPLGERQFPPTSLNPPSIFARPSSQDFRVDMLATSSSTSANNNSDGSQTFHRINHHQQHLPPHSAPSLPGLGIGNFEPHNPFIDRGPLGIDTRHRPPTMSLGFEPQMDFYSQRLRQLAGATSPTTVAASPRKLTPPFTHPPMSSSSQPSTPTSTPQPALNLHNSSSGNVTPASNHQHNNNNNQAHTGSSASSTSSKGGGATDAVDGSPKLLKSWSCEFCGKAFRFQSNLIVHRRSHTGEKPYKCPICRHSCSQASKLKRHMKTHQESNGKTKNTSENNNLESPRSTPDSTSETGKERDRQGGRSIEEDEDASDGQTADNEEDEEDLDDEDEEEEDDLDDEDLEDSNEVLMAEDLSTRGPTNSTPIPRESPNSDQTKTSKSPVEDVAANNDNSSNTISISNGENGSNSRDKENSKPEVRHSLLSEVMDKIGLSNIQQYNEAYQKALEESSLKNSSKNERESPKRERSQTTENGPERLNNREDGNNNINSHDGSSKSLSLRPPMDFGSGFFGAFDYHHAHSNSFEANKRFKLDIADHLRNNNDRDPLYAGLWLPSVHGPSSRELYDSDFSRHIKSSSSESALKSVTPTNMSSRSMSPRPGTSGGGASITPISGILVNSSKSGSSSKEQRRNDTCEFCGKVFKNCSNLTVHRRSHTGEKPYKCELCSYACAQSSKLTRHMKTHGRLGKDVYRCRFCDMPFSVPSTLEKHMRKCVVNQNATGVTYMDRDSDSKDIT